MDASDFAKGSPTTLSSQWGSFLDSYSRPTWSATKTSRLLFIKIKQKDVTFVMLFLLCILCFIFQNEFFSSNFIPSLENQQPCIELPCLGELKERWSKQDLIEILDLKIPQLVKAHTIRERSHRSPEWKVWRTMRKSLLQKSNLPRTFLLIHRDKRSESWGKMSQKHFSS